MKRKLLKLIKAGSTYTLYGIFLLMLPVNIVLAQSRIITGTVTSAEGETLPGVNVIEKGTANGSATSAEGQYTISVSEGATLVVTAVGYMPTDILVGSRSVVDVVMTPDIHQLEEVVVVGYGTQKMDNLTGAVSTIESKQLESRSVTRVEQALQGQVPGLKVVQTSGQPGNVGLSMQIRGVSTFTSNPVLTIIDGIPGDFSTINPNDIESISVLKDAAAAAIYGARASGGVIIITTKTGKEGKPRVSYEGQVGLQKPTRLPQKVSAYQHAVNYNEAQANSNPGITNFAFSDEDLARFSSPDWKDPDMVGYLINEALQTQHNISLSGGSREQDYFLSLGYLYQDGIVRNTGYKRYNVQYNQNIQLSNKFKLSFKGRIAPSERTAPSEISYPGGSATSISTAIREAFRYGNEVPLFNAAGQWTTIRGSFNPIALASEDGGQQILKSNVASGNLSLDFDVLKDLKLTAVYGINYTQGRQQDYTNRMKLYNPLVPGQVDLEYTTGALRIINQSSVFQSTQLLANYTKSLADHNISVMAGFTQESSYDNYESVGRSDFLTDDIYSIGAGSTDQSKWVSGGGAAHWAIRSFIGRMSYSYLDKYLLEVSARYDGSSRFVEDVRWGLFPALSAGWKISEESFLKDNRVLNFLKVRASWGQVGNQNVGNYPFANTLSTSTYYFNGLPQRAVYGSGSPNPGLTWETKTSTNAGIDLGIFNDLIDFNIDVFKERTKDILLIVPLPTTYARREPYQNVGTVDNTGWELKIGHRNNFRNLEYGVSFQISDASTKVVDMAGTGPWITSQGSVTNDMGGQITEEGYPMNVWYGLEAAGLFQSVEEVNAHSFQSPETSPGDLKYKENGGDPNTINADDRVRLGRSDPRFPFGVSLNLKYKNFDFMAFGQGVSKHMVHLYGWIANNFDRPSSTIYTQHLDRWTPENPDGHFPKHRIAQEIGINAVFSDFWLQDAAYFRMKNIQIGYNMPEKVLGKLKMSRARFYISGENLFTVTKFTGFDPELPSVRDVLYPNSKIFSAGVNLTL